MREPGSIYQAVYEAIVKQGLSDYHVGDRREAVSDVVIQSLATIIPTIALIMGLYYFLTKQMNAMEDRLRDDIRDVDDRLRADIKTVSDSVETAKSELRGEIATAKSELRAEIVAAEERLRGEIKMVAESVEKGNSDLSHRIDRMDDKVSRLIQDVGVVQGAVLGVSVETAPREQPAVPN